MLKTGISSIKKITTGLVAVLISTYCLGQGLNVELGINSAYDQQPKSKIVYIFLFGTKPSFAVNINNIAAQNPIITAINV